jgi:hypothetical protein
MERSEIRDQLLKVLDCSNFSFCSARSFIGAARLNQSRLSFDICDSNKFAVQQLLRHEKTCGNVIELHKFMLAPQNLSRVFQINDS